MIFTDDLAVFSLITQHGLQVKLDILEKYCRQWDLEFKSHIINKGVLSKDISFIIEGGEIKSESQYNLLSFLFIPPGTKHTVIENLIENGKKHGFKYKKCYDLS